MSATRSRVPQSWLESCARAAGWLSASGHRPAPSWPSCGTTSSRAPVVQRPPGLEPLAPDKDFERSPGGLAGLLTSAGLDKVEAATVEFVHCVHPEVWWSGPARGVARIGTIVEAQAPDDAARMKTHYDRLSRRYPCRRRAPAPPNGGSPGSCAGALTQAAAARRLDQHAVSRPRRRPARRAARSRGRVPRRPVEASLTGCQWRLLLESPSPPEGRGWSSDQPPAPGGSSGAPSPSPSGGRSPRLTGV